MAVYGSGIVGAGMTERVMVIQCCPSCRDGAEDIGHVFPVIDIIPINSENKEVICDGCGRIMSDVTALVRLPVHDDPECGTPLQWVRFIGDDEDEPNSVSVNMKVPANV